MSPQEQRVYDLLRQRRGELVTTDELMAALYPDPDDEPDAGACVMRMMISRLRRRRGVTIETVRGWRLPK